MPQASIGLRNATSNSHSCSSGTCSLDTQYYVLAGESCSLLMAEHLFWKQKSVRLIEVVACLHLVTHHFFPLSHTLTCLISEVR